MTVTVKNSGSNYELDLAGATIELQSGQKLRDCLYNNMQLATKDKAIEKFKNAEEYKLNVNNTSEKANLNYTAYPGKGDITTSISKETVSAAIASTGVAALHSDSSIICAWLGEDGKTVYVIIDNVFSVNSAADGSSGKSKRIQLYSFSNKESLEDTMKLVGTSASSSNQKELKSTAAQLQQSISTWYKTLRMIAIVGLLSVLVYVGIRILISSTGQDKAKYKKMLTDWVAAMCILFLLQYVMVFTMEMTEKITGIFAEANGKGLFNEDGSDALISTVRNHMKSDKNNGYENSSFMEMFSWLIIYLVLVIYTCVFIWQYLKRVVMLAFLTMVAPLIALTYPLDKIKDGQAQAFGLWIREYIFNALLPVIHIIIYYMLVGSAINFITDGGNWLYAIVAVGFVIPAEKFFRKMFGFDKATSVGQLGAAAGGAMVMNAINKMAHKPQKEGKEKEGKVRTTSNGGYSAGGGYSGNNGSGGGGTPDPTAGINPPLTTPLSGSNLTGGTTPPANGNNATKPKRSISNGFSSLSKKYINRNTPKKIRKLARKGITGAAGAALFGTYGLAAGIASGDVSNVGKYAAAGLLAGGYTGISAGDKLTEIEKENREAFRKGMWGEDEYNTQELIKQVWEDDKIYEQYGKENKEQFKEDIREFYQGGIKGEEEVIAALKMKNKNGITNTDAVTIAQLNQKISNSAYGDPTKRKKFEQDIATSLRNQGYQGDVNEEAKRQIRMIGDMKKLIEK